MLNTGRILSVILFFGSVFAEGDSHTNIHDASWMDTWLMSYDFGLTIWSIITFFLVLIILKWKAWGPLMNALDKREEEIKNALSAADKAKEDAEKASNDYEKLVQKAHSEAQQIISDGKVAGEKLKNDIELSARKNAEEIVEKANTHIDAERQKAIQEIKSIVIDLSLEAATKVIEKNLDTEDNKKLINQTLENTGQA